MKHPVSNQSRWDQNPILNSPGPTDIVHRDPEIRRGGRAGVRAEHAAACELSTLFQQEVSFPSAGPRNAASQANVARPDHKRILIVDDDAVVRGSLAAVLESEGFVVDEAQDGMEAVTSATNHAPDLVLLDLNMPHWDGWTAFTQLDRVTPLLPVIVITARPNQYPKAVKLGVDAFMEKPLNISVLVHAVRTLTNEDQDRHMRRITNRAFVTHLLGGAEAGA